MKRPRLVCQEEERLKKVLAQDRLATSQEMLSMLRSDMAHLLGDYFDLDPDSLRVYLDAKEDGMYVVRVAAKAVRIKA